MKHTLGSVVEKLFRVLNMIKDFEACMGSESFNKGYMMFSCDGRKYAMKIVEVDEDCQDYDLLTNIDIVEQYFK